MNRKKHAILIMAHNNIETLKKIIDLFDSKYFDIFVHIDKKSNINIEQDLNFICKESTLKLIKEIDIRWADFTQVECELLLLKIAKEFQEEYSYYHLISGADLPLKTNKEIYDFFENSNRKEFVHFQSNELPKEKINWIKYYHFFGKMSRTNKFIKIVEKISLAIQKVLHINRTKKCDIQFMTGANWFSITNEFVNYLLKKEDFIFKTFKNTRSSDEIFLQTILYNSHFKNNLYVKTYNDDYSGCMRMIDWKRGTPYVFKKEDYKTLKSSKYMFARKFNEKEDNQIIEKIYTTIKKEQDDNK